VLSEFRRTPSAFTALKWSKHHIYLGGFARWRQEKPASGSSQHSFRQSQDIHENRKFRWKKSRPRKPINVYKVYHKTTEAWSLLATVAPLFAHPTRP